MIRPLQIRLAEIRLQAKIRRLPAAPDGSGKIFAETRGFHREKFAGIGKKLIYAVDAGVIEPGTRVIQRGERLLVIVMQKRT